MRPIFAGPGAPRPSRPAGSPSSSASSGSSDGVLQERDRSPRAPVPAPVHVPIYPPHRMPLMDARRYRGLFGQRCVVTTTPPPNDDESSGEDPNERDDPRSLSDTSHSSRDVSSADTSQGSERESTNFSFGPSSHSLSGSSSENEEERRKRREAFAPPPLLRHAYSLRVRCQAAVASPAPPPRSGFVSSSGPLRCRTE
ncbi:hypothetical protein PIB30_037142 [Stylosanthes scabra]|uniref:Uncharacterized protein n=1 Tax=Stylosanthes scabra TaxID=79078 RepID=A0ABU6RE48_9FABA|nr:hypothetical protein [Stylosanthes scabra]